METLAVKLFNFISRLDLGVYYPLIVPSVVAAIFLIVFISGIFFLPCEKSRQNLYACRRAFALHTFGDKNRLRPDIEADSRRIRFVVHRRTALLCVVVRLLRTFMHATQLAF